jgi:cobalt-zinc-cadmium efflux system membrane fusion protein
MRPPETEPVRARRLPPALQSILVAAAAAVLGLVLFGVPALRGQNAAPPPDATPAQASGGDGDAAFHPTDAQWAGLHIRRVTVEAFAPTTTAEGRIALDDDRTVAVFSPYSGRVTRILARAGDIVAAGAPLFAIQASELSQAENDLISAMATARTAQAQLGLATANEARQHALYLGHGAALKDWQQSRVDLATAQGGLSTARIALEAVHNRLLILGESQAAIRALEAGGASRGASAETIVRAPIAGTITARQIGPGQNIVGASASAGAAASVFTIGDLSTLWLAALVPEEKAPFVHVGDPVRVRVLAYPGRVFAARITYVAAGIDPATHRLPVRAEVDNTGLALKPEMFARFDIQTGDSRTSPAVPDRAIVYEGADAHVWIADPAHKTLALRRITVGQADGKLVEVTSGVSPGESIVTSGAVFIDRAISGD